MIAGPSCRALPARDFPAPERPGRFAQGLDSALVVRDTGSVVRPGAARRQLAETLNVAYGAGLLSQSTLNHRLDLLFSSRLVEPVGLVGDLTRRAPQHQWLTAVRKTLVAALRDLRTGGNSDLADPPILLALDWSGGQDELLLGRHTTCDVLLPSPNVSRRHARLVFRDGSWILQDLESTNGTYVNHVSVGRCELHPGDHIAIGDHHLRID